jgi:hypothetical protein
LRVIQTDRRNGCHDGLNNVRAVESSTHAHFNNGNVYLLFSEVMKSEGRSYFEEGRFNTFPTFF